MSKRFVATNRKEEGLRQRPRGKRASFFGECSRRSLWPTLGNVDEIFGNCHDHAAYVGPWCSLFRISDLRRLLGYSDIAIGTARLFGIQLMTNFKMPYFSRDIAEFWRRWHISLSTWFRDYLYIPLEGLVRGSGNPYETRLSSFWSVDSGTEQIGPLSFGGHPCNVVLPLLLLGLNRRHTNELDSKRWLLDCRDPWDGCDLFLCHPCLGVFSGT